MNPTANGPLFAILCLLLCPPTSAQQSEPKGKPSKPFNQTLFGEVPEKPYVETPDQSDFIENAPRHLPPAEEPGEEIPLKSHDGGNVSHDSNRSIVRREGSGTMHWMG